MNTYDELVPTSSYVMCLSDSLSLGCGTLCLASKTIGVYYYSGQCYQAIPSVVDTLTILVINEGRNSAVN
ncbi:MAG: hypothetical protein HQM13_05455 [SAR324 cluster bacterium]|nr:hypothetical protein [SAR324 cluster bacterium]